MPTRFDNTIAALKKGVKDATVDQGVKNIESWEQHLEKIESADAKKIVKDLEKLKELIQEDEIDGKAVRTLVKKLGRETVKIAGEADKNEAKVKQIGELLVEKADEEVEEDEAPKKKAAAK